MNYELNKVEVISGKDMAAALKQQLAADVVKYAEEYGRKPNLVVILVGDDPGSVSYVTGKAKAADEVGIDNSTIRLSEQTTEEELLDLVRALNVDTTVDGILVQLPLPNGINEEKVIETIAKEKDVDGFHPMNVAALWQKRPCVLPCTPKGIIRLMKNMGIEIAGKRAVVIGRSNIVGLPVTKLLMDENATVTVCHSRTKDIAKVCSEADILVPALGRPKFVKAEMVKEGAVVIDVGVNRDPETGKLCGDVDFDEVAPKASYITKVPGGVGPMTIACLMENTVECYLNNVKAQAK
jgi:methylenetetrahydrofolate dehydrogenase (NADP+)/methenyltetrahydrofolate cyclohydrolase